MVILWVSHIRPFIQYASCVWNVEYLWDSRRYLCSEGGLVKYEWVWLCLAFQECRFVFEFLFGCGFRGWSFSDSVLCFLLVVLLYDKSCSKLPLYPDCLLLFFGLVLDVLAHSSYYRCLSPLRSWSRSFRGEQRWMFWNEWEINFSIFSFWDMVVQIS